MGDSFFGLAWGQSLADSLERFGSTMSQWIPLIAGALLILIIGWLVSLVVRAIARRALRGLGVDRAAQRLRVTDNLSRLGIQAELSEILAQMLFWLLILTFAYAATDSLGLDAATNTINRLIAYLPQVAGAALVFIVGLILGRALQKAVGSSAVTAGLPQSQRLGRAAYGVTILVASVVAIEQLGLKTDVLVKVITIMITALCFTVGLAFALGAYKLVTHILAGHYLRQSLAGGKTIEVAGHRGVVQRIGAVNTELRHGDESWIVPNAMVLESIVIQ